MNRLTKIVLCITVFLQSPQFVYAELDFGFAKEDGGKAGAFLSYGAGARSLAMGRAFTSISNDVSAVYSNPAGLMQIEKQQITVQHAALWEDTACNFFAYAYPFYTGCIGIGLVNLNSSQFDKRDVYNNPLGTADISENCLLVSYARQSMDIMVGYTLKIINEKIDTYTASSIGADIGILFGLNNKLFTGFQVQNLIQPVMKLKRDEDRYPITVNGGISYSAGRAVLLSADVVCTENRQPKLRTGMEYKPHERCSLRAGLNEAEITVGFGIQIDALEIGYAFVYHDAFQGYADLGASHRFGITYAWGPSLSEE